MGKKREKEREKAREKRRKERESERKTDREREKERGSRRERKPVVYRGGLFMTMREVKQSEATASLLAPVGPVGPLMPCPLAFRRARSHQRGPGNGKLAAFSAIRGASSVH